MSVDTKIYIEKGRVKFSELYAYTMEYLHFLDATNSERAGRKYLNKNFNCAIEPNYIYGIFNVDVFNEERSIFIHDDAKKSEDYERFGFKSAALSMSLSNYGCSTVLMEGLAKELKSKFKNRIRVIYIEKDSSDEYVEL